MLIVTTHCIAVTYFVSRYGNKHLMPRMSFVYGCVIRLKIQIIGSHKIRASRQTYTQDYSFKNFKYKMNDRQFIALFISILLMLFASGAVCKIIYRVQYNFYFDKISFLCVLLILKVRVRIDEGGEGSKGEDHEETFGRSLAKQNGAEIQQYMKPEEFYLPLHSS